jgi:hypothetical protein
MMPCVPAVAACWNTTSAPAPPPAQLPPGEVRNHKATDTFAFAQKLQQPQRRARRRRKPQPANEVTSALGASELNLS